MEIAKLYERILIQKNEVTIDSIGNHRNEWSDYYNCYTYPTTYMVDESEGVVPLDNQSITFLVRACTQTKAIVPTGYRIIFKEKIYDIVSVDPMNYDNERIKIRCKLVDRNE